MVLDKRKGTSWTSTELKYIGEYAKRKGLKLAMGRYPKACFIKDGEPIEVDIQIINLEMYQALEEDKKERAREKKAADQEAKQQSYGRRFSGGN